MLAFDAHAALGMEVIPTLGFEPWPRQVDGGMQAPNYSWLERIDFIHTLYHQLQGLGRLSQHRDCDVLFVGDNFRWRVYGFGFCYAQALGECFGDGAPPAVAGVYESGTFVLPYLDWKEVIKSSLLIVDI